MNAILLCAGPSLANYRQRPADLVVAVNRAALRQPCDVWAIGDWPLIEQIREAVATFQPKLPRLFTAANSHSHLRDHSPLGEWGNPNGGDVTEFESLFDGHEDAHQWTAFTATAALWYCFWQGVKTLDVFGADWGGATYCDGKPISQNRVDLGETGWALERSIWTRLVDHCGLHGMTVTRHLP